MTDASYLATTRPRKSLEVNGRDYTFISKTRMEDGIFNNQFIEYGEHKGHYYGTSLAAIRDVVKKGKVCILAVNPKVCCANVVKISTWRQL